MIYIFCFSVKINYHFIYYEVTAQNMAGGKPFGPEVVTLSFRQVFLYFESAIYLRFDLPVRRFLLELASFETFDLEMARMVSGNPHAGEMLDWLQRNTTMLRYDGIQANQDFAAYPSIAILRR